MGSGLIGHDPEKEFYGPIAENVNTNNYFADSHYDLQTEIVKMVSPESGRSYERSNQISQRKLDNDNTNQDLQIVQKFESDEKSRVANDAHAQKRGQP